MRYSTAGDTGTGLVASIAGVAVFCILMLLAVQVLLVLYARSVVGAAAFDAVRIASGSDAGATPAALAAAESQARRELGAAGAGARFRWIVGARTLALRVRLAEPSLLPRGVAALLRIDTVTRTVVLPIEGAS